MRVSSFFAAVAVLAAPVAVFAADGPAAKAKTDANRMVCETTESTGSRLGKKKVCRTAAEWTEIKAAERRDIERMQANRSKNN